MKVENLIFIENRLHQDSTQIYLENIEFNGDVFFIPVGNYNNPIGFLKFKNIAKKGCFELAELVPLDYPNPNPKLSLSGVLYSRQKAIEAHQSINSFPR